MLRRFCTVLIAVLATVSPAFAEESVWPDDLTGMRCEDHVADISADIQTHEFDDGTPVTSVFTNMRVTGAKTISSTPTKLVCRIKYSFQYRGSTEMQNGKYTVRLSSDRATVYTSYDPTY